MALSIQDVPFFKGLSEAELAAVRGCLRERSFAKGEALFLEGAACERVFFVRSGRVKLYRLGPSGREQILQTLEPGDTCACNPGEAGWTCASTAEAASDASVWFLSRTDYLELLRTNTRLSRSLTRLFAERIQCLSSLVEEVALKDSGKRLAKFLLDMLEAGGGRDGSLEIAFTREELASRLGMARETVARQLYRLKDRKLIDILPHRIVIRDREKLRRTIET